LFVSGRAESKTQDQSQIQRNFRKAPTHIVITSIISKPSEIVPPRQIPLDSTFLSLDRPVDSEIVLEVFIFIPQPLRDEIVPLELVNRSPTMCQGESGFRGTEVHISIIVPEPKSTRFVIVEVEDGFAASSTS
jgi:hypothetical protein